MLRRENAKALSAPYGQIDALPGTSKYAQSSELTSCLLNLMHMHEVLVLLLAYVVFMPPALATQCCRSERAIVTRTWEQQADDALPTPGRHPYQSQAVAFAVRAAEAFASCTSRYSLSSTELEASACTSPQPEITAVCCRVRCCLHIGWWLGLLLLFLI